MWNLISTSFFVEQQYVMDIIRINGIDNLNYNQFKQKLAQKLEENESEDYFIITIKKMQHKPDKALNKIIIKKINIYHF